MKKCPFCAEEIQDEAIKCRFCGSSLSAPPSARDPRGSGDSVMPVMANEAGPRTIYDGSPSWKAYIGYYLIVGLAAAIAIAILWTIRGRGATTATRLVDVGAPLVVAAVLGGGIWVVRRSIRFRVTTTAIEYERGLLSKRIDVLQLWRVRDVVYRQHLVDRVLGIAHVDVIAQDTTTPLLAIVGMPASRQLFEQLRDSIEAQHQAKNLVGVIGSY